MDKYNNISSYEIRQSWVVSSFLPPPRDQNVEQEVPFEKFQIDECLGCEDRDWNVPEMLIEFRMVAEAAGVIPTMYEYCYPIDPREHPYGKIQAGLFLVFQLLRKWAIDYKHSRIALKQVYEDKQEFLNFWDKNKTIIYRLRPAPKGSISCTPPNTDEIHNVLRKFAELLKMDVLLQQNCWPDLLIGLEEHFREINAREGGYIESKSLEQLGLLLYRFCRSYLSRSKENAAGKKIHTIEKSLRELPVYPELSKVCYLPRCNKWDNEYLDAVGILLQTIVNNIGNTLNEGYYSANNIYYYMTSHATRPVEKMLDRVKRAMIAVGIAEETVRRYIDENGIGRKCVAMLYPQGKKPIIAFSGYSDTSDGMVEKYLYSGSLYKDFSELCTRYHIALANLSPEVVDKIVHFEYGKNVGTMRHYLKRAIFNKSMTKKPIPTENLKKELREIIEKKYSCCERKIIAKLEADGLSSRNAILYIKLSPCESCADALSYWKKKQRCEWKITYLYQ